MRTADEDYAASDPLNLDSSAMENPDQMPELSIAEFEARFAGERYSCKFWPRGYAHEDGPARAVGASREDLFAELQKHGSFAAATMFEVRDRFADAVVRAAIQRRTPEEIARDRAHAAAMTKGDNS